MTSSGGARPARVQIVEVSPRDGLQNEAQALATDAKLDLIGRVVAAGARRVEVTGFARPDVVPALADADSVAAAMPADGVEYSALVLNGRGYDRAVTAGIRAVSMVVLCTETFSRRNQRMSVAESVEATRVLRERSAADGVTFSVTVAASFGCPFEGEVPLTRLREVVGRIADLGPDELSLADTIGVGTPGDVAERFGVARELAPGVPLRAHFHDTRNTGVANAVAAVHAGVEALDASLGGIGGCPFAPAATGNVATEDVVYCLERMGIETGLDLGLLIGDSRWLTAELGRPASSGLARAGAFPQDDR
jgi:hydroxymethylglutaryl-CoA lyase